jgi:hypothetical protein
VVRPAWAPNKLAPWAVACAHALQTWLLALCYQGGYPSSIFRLTEAVMAVTHAYPAPKRSAGRAGSSVGGLCLGELRSRQHGVERDCLQSRGPAAIAAAPASSSECKRIFQLVWPRCRLRCISVTHSVTDDSHRVHVPRQSCRCSKRGTTWDRLGWKRAAEGGGFFPPYRHLRSTAKDRVQRPGAGNLAFVHLDRAAATRVAPILRLSTSCRRSTAAGSW